MPPPIAARVLYGASTAASLVVLLSTAVHSADLGPNPAWLFDCNDTTCVDLWIDARVHYRTVGFVALAVGSASWLLLGTTMSRRVSNSVARKRTCTVSVATLNTVAYATLGALGPIFVFGALLASGGTLPGVLAVGAAIAMPASLLLWGALLVRTGRERYSWFAAALIVAASFAVGALVTAALFPVLFVAAPVAAVLPTGVAGLVGMRIAVKRGCPTMAEEPAEEERVTVQSSLASTSGAIIGVIVIATVAGFAARPVPAPPADAVAESDDTYAFPEQPARSTDTPSEHASPSPIEPVTPRSPDGLPLCGRDDVILELASVDSVGGDSIATLVATNVGMHQCGLAEAPILHIFQGGRDLEIRTSPMEPHRLATTPPQDGLGLAPGERAESVLFWRGYRSAADQTTPQNVAAELAEHSDSLPVSGAHRIGLPAGPAPFDVMMGAEIHSSKWQPRQMN